MRKELTGNRDLGFSRWHRDAFGPEASAFDVDLMMVCNACNAPLYAVEATQAGGQKATTMLRQVTSRLGVPAVLVVYTNDDGGNLLSLFATECGAGDIGDADALVEFELRLRDEHHRSKHPDLPTFVYRKRNR